MDEVVTVRFERGVLERLVEIFNDHAIVEGDYRLTLEVGDVEGEPDARTLGVVEHDVAEQD